MAMLATSPQIGQTGFDFLADKDFIHQIIPTGSLRQLAHQTGCRLLDGSIFFCGRHKTNEPQNKALCKPTFHTQQAIHITGGNLRVDNTALSAGLIANRNDGAAVSLAGAQNATLRFDDSKTLIIQSQPKAEILAGSSFGLNTMVTISHANFAVELAEGFHVRTGTGTGSRIGTATNQKFAFWGATPTTQPTAVANATDAASVITQLNALLARLRTIGLIANS
jgi:hypothetical protein